MDCQHLNLRHVRAFYEVGRCGSITGATKQVFLSQSAITQAIANLETLFETQFFRRKNSGMFLTEPGTLFFNRVQRALTNLTTGARRAQRRADPNATGGFKNFEQSVTSAQLRSLLAIAKAKNFSLAARKTGIAQPSLYRAARDLERISGIQLFVSNSRGVELTPAAEVLARFARLSFAELNQGSDEVSAWHGRDTTRISIGTIPLSRNYVLPRAIDELTRRHPDVQVSVMDGAYSELLEDLREGNLDFIVGALRDPVPIDDVQQDLLFRDVLSVFARVGHPLAKAKRITMKDLEKYPWVVSRPDAPIRLRWEALFQDAGLTPPERRVESNSIVLIRDLLMESDRLTLVSAHQIEREVEQGLIQALDVVGLDQRHTTRSVGTTVRKDWQPTPTQALLLELLHEAASEIIDAAE